MTAFVQHALPIFEATPCWNLRDVNLQRPCLLVPFCEPTAYNFTSIWSAAANSANPAGTKCWTMSKVLLRTRQFQTSRRVDANKKKYVRLEKWLSKLCPACFSFFRLRPYIGLACGRSGWLDLIWSSYYVEGYRGWGRWSVKSAAFSSSLARARARQAPAILQQCVATFPLLFYADVPLMQNFMPRPIEIGIRRWSNHAP